MRIALVLVVATGCDAVYDLRGRKPDAAVDAEVIIDAPIDAAEVVCAKDPMRTDDEDGDDFPNSCDNCPHVFQTVQRDDDGDGVGEECDPRPTLPDSIDYFDGFDALPQGLELVPTGTWRAAGGRLLASQVPVATNRLARLKHGLENVTVITRLYIEQSDDASEGAGVFAWIEQPNESGSEVYPPGVLLQMQRDVVGGTCRILETFPLDLGEACTPSQQLFSAGAAYTMTLDCRTAASPKCTGTISYDNGTPGGAKVGVSLPSAIARTGPVGLRAYAVDVAFDYIVVIRHD